MKAIINKHINGSNGRPIVYDFLYDKKITKSPVVIFCHGYKGFKDWGAWPLLANTLASKGVAFLKFNFSKSLFSTNKHLFFNKKKDKKAEKAKTVKKTNKIFSDFEALIVLIIKYFHQFWINWS